MLDCYIIDDEEHAIKTLLGYIEQTSLLTLIGYNKKPLDALSFFQQTNTYPDITFLDIDMPQISGLELCSLLAGKTEIVFTTAHSDFALQGFDMDISDYLLKPISLQRFLKCVNKINDRIGEKNQKESAPFFYIQTEGKGKLIKILFGDVLYIESQKNYVSIVTSQKKYLTYLTLTEIEGRLSHGFMRINKSFVINTDKISHLEGDEIFLDDLKTSFLIGCSYKQNFTNYMKEYLVKTSRFHH